MTLAIIKDVDEWSGNEGVCPICRRRL